jgi:hypothetical protein
MSVDGSAGIARVIDIADPPKIRFHIRISWRVRIHVICPFLDVCYGSAGKGKVLSGIADGVGRTGMVQDTLYLLLTKKKGVPTFLDVCHSPAGEGEVLPGIADGIGGTGMVQNACDREQALTNSYHLELSSKYCNIPPWIQHLQVFERHII